MLFIKKDRGILISIFFVLNLLVLFHLILDKKIVDYIKYIPLNSDNCPSGSFS